MGYDSKERCRQQRKEAIATTKNTITTKKDFNNKSYIAQQSSYRQHIKLKTANNAIDKKECHRQKRFFLK